jgi:DNA-binding CsgD family transcriptional regulator
LVQRVPSAVVALGFDRVLFSHVEGRRWTPAAGHPSVVLADDALTVTVPSGRVLHPPVEGAPGLLVGGPSEEIVRSYPEYDVLSDPRPARVHGTPAARGLVRAWQSSAYVVAPVVRLGRVVGLLHADCHVQERLPDQLDEELLGAFAEALASALDCARAVDSLRAMRNRMTLLAAEFDQPSRPEAGVVLCPPVPDCSLVLTSRERQVLELMATGQTNRQIARRLVITEGTAKSHVKRILRKLHAANRAEAVAAWVRTDAATAGGAP